MSVKLTDKQELFCKKYIIHLNATKAAIESGYSEKTAYSIGSENLSKPEIQDRIAKLRKKTLEKLDISHQRIAEEYAKIAFSDMADCVGEGNKIKAVADIKNTPAISSLSTDVFVGKNGITTKTKITLHNKKDGLDGLSRHTGFYEADNKQKVQPQIVIQGENAQEGMDNLPDPDK